MTTTYNDELNTLINCISVTFGDEIGQAVQDKFDQVLALHGADVNAISAQIAQLNALLASNTEGDQLTAQSILAQLSALDSRLDVLEGSTAVADLAMVVEALQTALAAETTARGDGDDALRSDLAELEAAVATLTQQVVTIQNEGTGGTGGSCDCVAMTAAIADLTNRAVNLEASDAQQSIRITALQDALAGLSTSTAAIAAAQAAADAAAAAAAVAAATAASAQATANNANTVAAGAAAAVAALEASNAAAHDTFITVDMIKNVNCVVHGQSFRTALRGRLFGLAGGNGN
jgi:trimeric autotransporter adhesin